MKNVGCTLLQAVIFHKTMTATVYRYRPVSSIECAFTTSLSPTVVLLIVHLTMMMDMCAKRVPINPVTLQTSKVHVIADAGGIAI